MSALFGLPSHLIRQVPETKRGTQTIDYRLGELLHDGKYEKPSTRNGCIISQKAQDGALETKEKSKYPKHETWLRQAKDIGVSEQEEKLLVYRQQRDSFNIADQCSAKPA